MKAIRWMTIFIAVTFVSSALACGNSNVSNSDESKQVQAKNYQLPPAPSAPVQQTSTAQ
jgi:hypothetical protein